MMARFLSFDEKYKPGLECFFDWVLQITSSSNNPTGVRTLAYSLKAMKIQDKITKMKG